MPKTQSWQPVRRQSDANARARDAIVGDAVNQVQVLLIAVVPFESVVQQYVGVDHAVVVPASAQLPSGTYPASFYVGQIFTVRITVMSALGRP